MSSSIANFTILPTKVGEQNFAYIASPSFLSNEASTKWINNRVKVVFNLSLSVLSVRPLTYNLGRHRFAQNETPPRSFLWLVCRIRDLVRDETPFLIVTEPNDFLKTILATTVWSIRNNISAYSALTETFLQCKVPEEDKNRNYSPFLKVIDDYRMKRKEAPSYLLSAHPGLVPLAIALPASFEDRSNPPSPSPASSRTPKRSTPSNGRFSDRMTPSPKNPRLAARTKAVYQAIAGFSSSEQDLTKPLLRTSNSLSETAQDCTT